MKIQKLVFLISCLLHSPFLFAGDGVGTGGGLVESQFILAYSRADLYLRETLVRKPELPEAQKQALMRILNGLTKEKTASEALVFEADATRFEWKQACDELKLAYTSLEVGSPIFLNLSKLYLRVEERLVPAISFSSMVQILVHELGHHHGYLNHAWLDELGGQVAGVALSLMEKELISLENYIKKLETLGSASLPEVELKDLEGRKREQISGVFFPLRMGESLGPNVRIHFLPNGGSKLYPVSIVKSLLPSSKQEFRRATEGGLPFRGTVEKVASGKTLSGVETLIATNVWVSTEMAQYKAGILMGRLYLNRNRQVVLDLTDSKDSKRVSFPRVFVSFVDNQVESQLVSYLMKNHPTNALVFLAPETDLSFASDRIEAVSVFF